MANCKTNIVERVNTYANATYMPLFPCSNYAVFLALSQKTKAYSFAGRIVQHFAAGEWSSLERLAWTGVVIPLGDCWPHVTVTALVGSDFKLGDFPRLFDFLRIWWRGCPHRKQEYLPAMFACLGWVNESWRHGSWGTPACMDVPWLCPKPNRVQGYAFGFFWKSKPFETSL